LNFSNNQKGIEVMRKIGLAILLMMTFGMAQASSLNIVNPSSSFDIVKYNGDSRWIAGGYKTAGVFGALSASGPGTITVTYLGNSSLWLDDFKFGDSLGGGKLTEKCYVGQCSISAEIGKGIVDFMFEDDHGGLIKNGATHGLYPSFAFLLDNKQSTSYAASFDYGKNAGKKHYDFQYLLGFNDSWGGDADFDDYVVGINFVPSPVPLPAAAWLFATALLGFTALSSRRRV
jgi:hypothetical protein